MKRTVGTICFLLLLSSLCSAEVVYLKNGKKIQGKIVEKNDQQTKVDVSGVTITYFSDEIDRIEGGTGSAAAPAPAPASAPAPRASVPAALAAVPSAGGEVASQDLVMILIDSSGTREAMNQMFTQVISEAPPEEAAKLKEIFNIDQIVLRLVPVYQKYFTAEDMKGLIAFYNSPIGRKFIKVSPMILEDSMQASMTYFREKMPAEETPPAGQAPAPAQ